MGAKYRQRFGANSKAFRAGVWAARVEALFSFVVILVADSIQSSGLQDSFVPLLVIPGIILIANSTLLPILLIPIQWCFDERVIVEKAFRFKLTAGTLFGTGFFLTLTNVIWEWNGAFFWPATIHVLVSIGLALMRYVQLHEQAELEGPADWAVSAARRIAEQKD